MSRLFPAMDCYEIYPLKNLNHPIFDVVLSFDLYESIALGADLSIPIDELKEKFFDTSGIYMPRKEFIYILSAVLKNKDYYRGENLKSVRICTV